MSAAVTVVETETTVEIVLSEAMGPPGAAGEGSGAPTAAKYLVTEAHAGLSAEVVVGATPGGELGGTWAAPTVDATHSGSSHAAVQAAAEATAAADATTKADAAQAAAEATAANADNLTSGTVADARIPSTITRDSEVTDAITAHSGATDPHGDRAYTDSEIASAVASNLNYRGGYDASTNTPDLDSSPSGVELGDVYAVTAAGTFFTAAVEVGDLLIAEVDGADAESEWTVLQANISFTAAQILAMLTTVDGSGSGLDADLLDGQHAAALLDRANHTGSQAQSTITDLVTDLAAKAPLASPTFTGDVVVPDANAATEAMNRQTSDARYAPISIPVEDESGTSYTVDSGDAGRVKRFTNASLCTVTLPDGIAVGTIVELLAWGAAGIAVQDNGTSTVQVEGAVAQYEAVSCVVVATNTWSVVGPLT